MEFSDFTVTVTGDCNFSCSYCYQKKEKEYLDITAARKAVDFFFPFLAQDCFINFYGGEPLLAFEQIKEIVGCIEHKNKSLKKKIQYSITSNGSCINEDVLQFLNQNKFIFMLSFDGLAQDMAREKGSFDPVCSSLAKLLECPDIILETNSVFTFKTVGYLSRSIQFIIESGVSAVNLSFSNLPPWNESALSRLKREMASLQEYCVSFHRETGNIPVMNLRKIPGRGVFGCSAGRDRMSLSPDGSLWGCCFFSDFYRSNGQAKENLKYCFGSVESFVNNHKQIYPKILKNYSNLRMGYFFTSQNFCTLCEEVTDCVVCPVDAALGSLIIGKIPDWVCRIRKILREEKQLFLEELERV